MCDWSEIEQCPPLSASQIHIWRLSLAGLTAMPRALWSVLSPEEQARAQRFVRPQDQYRFVRVRGRLRGLLGQYLGLEPARLSFRYGPKGKPELEGLDQDLTFNLSHSGDWAVFAIARHQAIGIDLEGIKTSVDYEGIARRFFQAAEVQAITAVAPEHRCHRFFQIWTRKEAVIKAMGGSIATGLDAVDVAAHLDDPKAMIEVHGAPGQVQQWRLWEFEVRPGYVGALATGYTGQPLHPTIGTYQLR